MKRLPPVEPLPANGYRSPDIQPLDIPVECGFAATDSGSKSDPVSEDRFGWV